MTDRIIRTAQDADSIRDDIEQIHDGWYARGPIDWNDFHDRLEARGYDLGDSLTSPAIRRIRRIVRELRAEDGTT